MPMAPAPKATPTAPATGDPAALIRATCQGLAEKPAAAWVNSFELQSFDQDTAVFVPRTGQREMLKFATPPMQGRLAATLSEALGRKVKVVVNDTKPGSDRQDASSAPEGSARDRARKLPIVTKVMDVFPDATMIDARDDEPKPDSES